MAALTRYQYEQRLVARTKAVMVRGGLSTTLDPATPNPDLNDPLADALALLGFTVNDPSLVTDADLVPAGDWWARLTDWAEIRVIESCLGGIASSANKIQFVDYQKFYANSIKDLQDLLKLKIELYQNRWLRGGTAAVGQTAVEIQNRFSAAGYYPPP